MRTTEEQHNERKREIMEKCFECYAENGLTGTGIKALAAACGCTTGNLYSYFNSVDELIIESTAYCMEKVEDDFMEKAPTDPKDVVRFVKEVPYCHRVRNADPFSIFIFVRACVHYAMFEDEYYLKTQMEVLKQGVALFTDKYRSQYLRGGNDK